MEVETHAPDIDCGCEECEEYFRQKAEDDAVDRYIEEYRERRENVR